MGKRLTIEVGFNYRDDDDGIVEFQNFTHQENTLCKLLWNSTVSMIGHLLVGVARSSH